MEQSHEHQVLGPISSVLQDDHQGSLPPTTSDFVVQEEKADVQEKDRGRRGLVVVLVSFLCNGVLFSVINCYGIINVRLMDQMRDDPDIGYKSALVGSLATGLTFFMSTPSSILVDRIGMMKTALIGSIVVTFALLLSSFFTNKIEALYVTYGLMFGTGASLIYTPSLVILGHYYEQKLGLVNGVVSMGSSVFTVFMPFLMTYLIDLIGLSGMLQVLTGLTTLLIPGVLVFRTHEAPPSVEMPLKKQPPGLKTNVTKYINFEIWKNRKYALWALIVPLGLFGYFVPYVHLVNFVKLNFPTQSSTLPVTCIGITSGIGRLIFGKVADLPMVNTIVLQQIAFAVIGLITIVLPFCESFWLLITMVLLMGLFDGCFVALIGPVAFQLVGATGASQAIGFILTLSSVPFTTGPPVAGILFDQNKDYTLAFCLAGCAPVIASLLMCVIHCMEKPPATPPSDLIKESR